MTTSPPLPPPEGAPERLPPVEPAIPRQLADTAEQAPEPSFLVVGVGASAGGLEAFSQMLKHLPLDTGMAFVLVQHLDPEHESALVQILDRASALPVREITEGMRVEPDQVYVIPRNASLRIERGVLKLQPRDAGRRPSKSIDAFFESLAQDQHERAVGVVLSGTANDGTLGLEAIRAEGGITFAQDDTAKHGSMPRSAIAAGVVDMVLSPAGIAQELARIAKHPVLIVPSPEPVSGSEDDQSGPDQGEENRVQAIAHQNDNTPLPSGGPPEAQPEPHPRSGKSRAPIRTGEVAEGTDAAVGGAQAAEEDYKQILLLLRNHSGVDFALYKSTTIRRRILRRLLITQSSTLGDYARFLKGNTKELVALYSDVLISVTSFFRNPETFESVQRTVLPALLDQRIDEPVRCWVLGCSTGQEAYSLAMAFVEVAEKAAHTRQLQVFATDLNEALLEKARHGLYAKSLADDISPQRLRRFFTEEQGGYRVSKSLREMVVFARQNLIADPPFSRMDLVSCRNLLIYLEPTLQKRAIPIFHYALRPGGYLLLGASESIGGFADLFEPVDKKSKIYAKKAAVTPTLHLQRGGSRGAQATQQVGSGTRSLPGLAKAGGIDPLDGLRGELNAQREADRIAITRFAPPGVLINDENQVLQFRGPTGAFLQPPAGKASFDVLKMAREGLMIPLRAAIEEARKEGRPARREGVRMQWGDDDEERGQTRTINLEVIPLRNVPERCFLVVFEEPDRTHRALRRQQSRPALDKAQEASRIAELEADLAANRDYLQATQEQHEATTEELQASNEEVQSANEELQSVNEELETSKEELESANEELTTVNDEMSHRNTELVRLNNDLLNLQSSTRLAILLVGRDLNVTRFSPHAEKLFDLLSTDVGRPVGHIRQQLTVAADGKPLDLENVAREVIASVREQEWEVRDKSGHWYSLRARPYMTLDNRIDGAVLVLVDIEALKGVEKVVEAARDYAQNTVSTVREPMLVLDQNFRVESANLAFYRAFGVAPKATIGRSVYDLGNGQWNIAGLRVVLETALTERAVVADFLVDHEFPGIGRKTMLLNARRMHDPQHQTVRILLAIEDITARLATEQTLRESEEARRFALEAANAGTWSWNRDTGVVGWSRECYDLFGIDPGADVVYDSWRNALHPDDRDRADASARRAMERGDNLQIEYRIRHSQRGERWLSAIGRIVDPVNRPGYMTGLVQDITERVLIENTVKAQAEQLAGESLRKDEFLAMLSHELRNPLAPIRAAVHVLRTQALAGGENSLQKQAHAIIERQVSNLGKLVSDLLEISRVVNGRIRLSPQTVDLNQIVRHAAETSEHASKDRNHELVLSLCPDPIWTNADPTRMEEVFTNVLNNAAKYTPDGGRIEIWSERTSGAEGHSHAQVRVRDNGVGIEPELLPRIFDLFTQADRSLARSAGGLGIGLTLVSRLVKLHSGTIVAHSPPEGETKGSEFIVALPLAAPPPPPGLPESEATPADADAIGGLRILLVDDNVDLMSMLSHSLRASGHSVQMAYTGPDGLKVAQQWRPDVVLLDIGLPGLDGYEVARRLRSDLPPGKTDKQMRIIAFTGYGRDADIARARDAGFDDHLIKPIEFKDLEKMIADAAPKPAL